MVDLTQPWQTARFVAFDLETTGMDRANDRIIEIGAVVFEGGEVVDRWQQLVDPEVELPPVITEITGITADDLQGMPRLEDIADKLVEYTSTDLMLAYNSSFDLEILANQLQRIGRRVTLPECLDPLPFVWKHLREGGLTKNAKLGTATEFLGIPLDAAHRADHDAEAAGRVMLALASHVPLPDSVGDLLEVQRVLAREQEEFYARRRRARNTEKTFMSPDEVVIELGAAYLYGEETDPVRALFSRVPDVRDLG
jgi:DNA polymerase III epsilon subunit family exonuclease